MGRVGCGVWCDRVGCGGGGRKKCDGGDGVGVGAGKGRGGQAMDHSMASFK